jgi:lipoprotein signal peptidase
VEISDYTVWTDTEKDEERIYIKRNEQANWVFEVGYYYYYYYYLAFNLYDNIVYISYLLVILINYSAFSTA